MHHNISFIMLLIRYLIARSHANFFRSKLSSPPFKQQNIKWCQDTINRRFVFFFFVYFLK